MTPFSDSLLERVIRSRYWRSWGCGRILNRVRCWRRIFGRRLNDSQALFVVRPYGKQSQLMAASVLSPLYSNPGMWNLGEQPNSFTSTGSEARPTSMAYQYPLAITGLDSPDIIPSFHHPLDRAQTGSASQEGPASPESKSLGNSAASKSAKIKRSMSTPNVRGQATAEAAALALSADKRRNKLGYHRTSVACGKHP